MKSIASFLSLAALCVCSFGCSSSSSGTSSTGDSAYRCADTGDDCTCLDPPPSSGYEATSCGSYPCCSTSSTIGQDGVTRKTCECTSDAVCIPPTNATRVASCP
ncbi:MAG TPA: hypothetical protein VF407_15605 [Polyangiaceae bacterium]